MESATIWMGGIDANMDSTFITEAFANVGFTALEVKEIFHKATGERASYCFVDFGDVNIAREVLIKVNNVPIPGTDEKVFKLNRSEYGRSSGGNIEYSMFVGDLTAEVTDDQLLDFFRKRYPSVRAAKVVVDNKDVPKGYGFVRFYNEEEHESALKQMQGMKGLGQRQIRVNRATKGGKQPTPTIPSNPANPANPMTPPQLPTGMDTTAFPGWMQMQMNYMQQMHQYMQQCQQYAQQAASYAGWYPQAENKHAKQVSEVESEISWIQQQHEKMIAQTTDTTDEDQELVDPNPYVDVAALNKKIIDQDDKLFFQLEASRWEPELSVFGVNEQRPVKVR